jgi:hypothetical protein
MRLTFEKPPMRDDPSVMTKAEIAAELTLAAGDFAIVARCDRAARAEAQVQRVNDGREYGPGFRAVYRQVGSEHRVYAMRARTGAGA